MSGMKEQRLRGYSCPLFGTRVSQRGTKKRTSARVLMSFVLTPSRTYIQNRCGVAIMELEFWFDCWLILWCLVKYTKPYSDWLRAGRPGFCSQKCQGFLLCHNIHTDSGYHPTSCPMGEAEGGSWNWRLTSI